MTQIDTRTKPETLKLLRDLQKRFGKEQITLSCDIPPVPRITSGLATLDLAIGGGVPVGRIIELYGPEASGKTTAALHIVKAFQDKGGQVVYIDSEQTLDPTMAEDIGVDMHNLILHQDIKLELALDIAKASAEMGANLIIVDSIPGLVTQRQIEGESDKETMAEVARVLGRNLPKLNGVLNIRKVELDDKKKGDSLIIEEIEGCTIIFINQEREQIGVFSPAGTPKTTPGGKALKFFASLRLRTNAKEVRKNGVPVSKVVTIEIKKSKVSKISGKIETTIDLLKGAGFDTIGAMVKACIMTDIITKKGGGYFILPSKVEGEENQIRGEDNLIKLIHENEGLRTQLAELLKQYNNSIAKSEKVVELDEVVFDENSLDDEDELDDEE